MKILLVSIIGISIFLFYQGIGGLQLGNISQILTKIESKANSWGLDPALVKAVVKVESNFKPDALNFEKSPEDFDDSYGLMQISPMLAEDYGLVRDYRNMSWLEKEMLFDIDNNLSVGCSHLSELIDDYSFDQAIQMYNVGITGYKINGARNHDYLNKVKVAHGLYS